MTRRDALQFIRENGAVLESARGPCPSFVEAVAGEAISGNWWAHPRSHEIFALTRMIRESDDLLVCRLVDGKITYIHRRLWPALIRAAERFAPGRLACVKEIHTAAGHHETEEIPFPDWVPAGVADEASDLAEDEALQILAEQGIRSPQRQPKFPV